MFGEEYDIAVDLGQGTRPCYQLKSITHINASDPDNLTIPWFFSWFSQDYLHNCQTLMPRINYNMSGEILQV